MLKESSSFTTNLNTLNFNFGPQHPAAHGVLRMVIQLKNEKIILCDSHIGLLHRGTEYLIETKPFYLSLPYFDRLDYVSMMVQEHCYCLAIESLYKKLYIPTTIQTTRVLFDEITRILNHLLAIACHALDIGSMSPLFWLFEERENLMELYEQISGARMHAAFYRPVFYSKNFTTQQLVKVLYIIQNVPVSINEVNSILLENKIWKHRLSNIGIVGFQQIKQYGLTGILARSFGLKLDLRLAKTTYSFYKFINFFSYVTKDGDSFCRYLLRIYEILESTSIINTVSNLKLNKEVYIYKSENFILMEKTISKFKVWSGTLKLSNGQVTSVVESPKGIFGVSLISNNSPNPFKIKIRSPSYNHLLWLNYAVMGLSLSDLITLIGTIDIVFGEIDRKCSIRLY